MKLNDKCTLCVWSEIIPADDIARINVDCHNCPRLPEEFVRRLREQACRCCKHYIGSCDELPEVSLSDAVQLCGHAILREGFRLKTEEAPRGTLLPGIKAQDVKKAVEILELFDERDAMWGELFEARRMTQMICVRDWFERWHGRRVADLVLEILEEHNNG